MCKFIFKYMHFPNSMIFFSIVQFFINKFIHIINTVIDAIYKFIHNLGLAINTLINQIQSNIKEFIPVDDVMDDDNIERSYQIIKNRFHETLLNYERNSDNGSHDFNSI